MCPYMSIFCTATARTQIHACHRRVKPRFDSNCHSKSPRFSVVKFDVTTAPCPSCFVEPYSWNSPLPPQASQCAPHTFHSPSQGPGAIIYYARLTLLSCALSSSMLIRYGKTMITVVPYLLIVSTLFTFFWGASYLFRRK